METTQAYSNSDSVFQEKDQNYFEKWTATWTHNSDEDTQIFINKIFIFIFCSTYDDGEEVDFYEANRKNWLEQKIDTEIQMWIELLHNFSWYYQYDENSMRNGVLIQMLDSFLIPPQKTPK